MSSDKNVKVYKNHDREPDVSFKPYVPQYQVHDKEPGQYQGAMVPSNTEVARPSVLPLDNPRAKRPSIRQPYAVTSESPIGRGRGLVPNVGNNMEHTWSNVDAEVIDDLSGENIDPNHPMIDNNEFVTDEAVGYQHGVTSQDIKPHETKTFLTEKELQQKRSFSNQEDLLSIVSDLEEGSYLLIVSSVAVCSGPLEEIQDQARALVFGEHEMCDGNPVPSDDIVIIKRVKMKVGLFLE